MILVLSERKIFHLQPRRLLDSLFGKGILSPRQETAAPQRGRLLDPPVSSGGFSFFYFNFRVPKRPAFILKGAGRRRLAGGLKSAERLTL